MHMAVPLTIQIESLIRTQMTLTGFKTDFKGQMPDNEEDKDEAASNHSSLGIKKKKKKRDGKDENG